MPQVLTTSADVNCGPAPAHGGKATLTSSSKLKVSGVAVLLQSGIGAIGGCKQSSSNTSPDLNVASIATGPAQKLMSDGSPVLLSTLTGFGDGKPPGAITGSDSQTKLAAS